MKKIILPFIVLVLVLSIAYSGNIGWNQPGGTSTTSGRNIGWYQDDTITVGSCDTSSATALSEHCTLNVAFQKDHSFHSVADSFVYQVSIPTGLSYNKTGANIGRVSGTPTVKQGKAAYQFRAYSCTTAYASGYDTFSVDTINYNYYVSTTGTATTKAAATGPYTDNSKCMTMATFNTATFGVTDTVNFKNGTYRGTSGYVMAIPSGGGTVYQGQSQAGVIINGSLDRSHGTSWHWNPSPTLANTYYITTAVDGDPSIGSAPNHVWVNGKKYPLDTLGSMDNRHIAYGDADALGFNTVYIRYDSSSFATNGAVIEFSSLYAFQKTADCNHYKLQNFTFTRGASSLFNHTGNDTGVTFVNCTFEKSNSICNWQDMDSTNFLNCTFQETYATSTNGNTIVGRTAFYYCLFKAMHNSCIYCSGVTPCDVMVIGCDFYGIGATPISTTIASQQHVQVKNCMFEASQYRESGTGALLNNASSAGGKISYKNSYIPGPCTSPATDRFVSCTDSGGNILTGFSGIKKHRYTPYYTWTFDDAQSLPVAIDSIRKNADSFDIKINVALSSTNHPGTYSNTAWWTKVDTGWLDYGHEISGHTRSHHQCDVDSAFIIQYTGEGSACVMTIDSTAKTLTTACTGATGDNLNVDLSNGKYYYGYGLDSICNVITNTGVYTCTAFDLYGVSSMYDSVTGKTTLKGQSAVDIKTAPYTVAYNPPVLYDYEIKGNISDIEVGTGRKISTFVWPSHNWNYTSVQACIDTGLIASRNIAPPTLGTDDFDLWDLYNMRPHSISDFLTTDTNTIRHSVFSLISYSGFTGRPSIFYEHCSAGSVTIYKSIIHALNDVILNNIAVCTTFTGMMTKIRSRGIIKNGTGGTNNANRMLEMSWPDSTDLSLKSSSQLAKKGDTAILSGIPLLYNLSGTQMTDAAGHVLFDSIPIGGYDAGVDTSVKCTLTVAAATGGTVNPSGAQIDTCGDSLKIVALPAVGRRFVTWDTTLAENVYIRDLLNDTTWVSKTDSTNATVTAIFDTVQYLLTVLHGTGSGTYDSAYAAAIAVTAPGSDSEFTIWSIVSGTGAFNGDSTTFAPGAITTIRANVRIKLPLISATTDQTHDSTYKAITAFDAVNTGGPGTYTYVPALPTGITGTTAGHVSGTPTAVTASGAYLMICTNTTGCDTASVTFQVFLGRPIFSYLHQTVTYDSGVTITPNTVISTGGAIASFAIDPALPADLSFNTTTGAITGTPAATQEATEYTVTGTNASNHAHYVVTITVRVVSNRNRYYIFRSRFGQSFRMGF